MKREFSAEYKVTIGDINYGGHMGNDRSLVIFQDARLQMLDSMNFSEKDIGGNSGIIMVESGVKYQKEVFLHDDLGIEITISEIKSKKFTLRYRVMRKSDEAFVFHGFTSFLAFDYGERKVVKLPDPFREKLKLFSSAEPL